MADMYIAVQAGTEEEARDSIYKFIELYERDLEDNVSLGKVVHIEPPEEPPEETASTYVFEVEADKETVEWLSNQHGYDETLSMFFELDLPDLPYVAVN